MKIQISTYTKRIYSQVERQLQQRAKMASHALRNSSQEILGGDRVGGSSYNVPGSGRVRYNKRKKTATIKYKKYAASAPGQPPAVRTGTLRLSWRPITFGQNGMSAAIESNVRYAGYLQFGTPKMAARPFEEKIVEMARPMVDAIYSQPFNIQI